MTNIRFYICILFCTNAWWSYLCLCLRNSSYGCNCMQWQCTNTFFALQLIHNLSLCFLIVRCFLWIFFFRLFFFIYTLCLQCAHCTNGSIRQSKQISNENNSKSIFWMLLHYALCNLLNFRLQSVDNACVLLFSSSTIDLFDQTSKRLDNNWLA